MRRLINPHSMRNYKITHILLSLFTFKLYPLIHSFDQRESPLLALALVFWKCTENFFLIISRARYLFDLNTLRKELMVIFQPLHAKILLFKFQRRHRVRREYFDLLRPILKVLSENFRGSIINTDFFNTTKSWSYLYCRHNTA